MNGPLLVLAGAGSGKTRVLTTRIARLIDVDGVDPTQILAVTFTNKAAGEMRERIGRLLGARRAGMWVGTFHAIGARMLRAAAHLVGRTPAFTIYDQDDSLGVVKRLMERHGMLAEAVRAARRCSRRSPTRRTRSCRRRSTSRSRSIRSRKAVAPVYRDLGEALQLANAVDFDDLLVLPVRHAAARIRTSSQRTATASATSSSTSTRTRTARSTSLIKLLGGEHGNVCVVGDDDQSIYGWRGADIRNILDFNKDFPIARRRPARGELSLDAADPRSRERRHQREHRPHGQDAARRRDAAASASPSSARSTSATRRTSSSTRSWRVARRRIAALRDFAVLYRTNAQSRALEEALRRHAMPYRLVGAVRFYDRREIRDLMAYLKLIANPADDEAFRRAVAVPKRGLGETTIEHARRGVAQRGAADVRGRARAPICSRRCGRPLASRSPSSSR